MTLTTTTHLDPDATLTLTFAMPARVAVEFQEQAGTILTDLIRNRRFRADDHAGFDLASWDSNEFTAPFDSNHRGDEDAWDLPPINASEADLRATCWAVDNWTDSGRSLAAVIISNPTGLRSRDIADRAGYSGGIPSAFRHVAGRLRAINRAPFWFGDPASKGHERGQLLSARPDTDACKVVRSIFEARYPELLER